MSAVATRPRALKRAPASIKRLAALRQARARIAGALRSRPAAERAVLAMLLLERLTPAEAAQALELPTAELDRLRRSLLADLRRVSRGGSPRPSRRGESPVRIVENLALRRAR